MINAAKTEHGIARCQKKTVQNLNVMNTNQQDGAVAVAEAPQSDTSPQGTPETSSNAGPVEIPQGDMLVQGDGTIDLAELENPDEENEGTNKIVIETVPPFTPEAEEWMLTPSVPGAHAGILYLSWDRAIEFANEVWGRPLDLDDVQFLIQKDGELQTCAISGGLFQPMKWPGFIGDFKKLREDLATAEIEKIDLNWRGSFFFDPESGTIDAVSGAVFKKLRKECIRDKDSYLIRMIEEIKKEKGFFKWGQPAETVLRRQAGFLKRKEWQRQKHQQWLDEQAKIKALAQKHGKREK